MNKLPVRLNRLFFIVVMAFAVISSSVLNSDLTFAEPGEIVEEPIEPGEITDPELPTIPPEEITDPEPPTTPPGEIIDPGQPPTTGGSGGDSNTPNPIKPPTPEITTPVNRPQKTVMETRLSMLTMNCGNLVPEFSPDIYEYTVYVTKDQENKNCGTSAESVDQTADISAEGPLEFTDEDVVKTITVTATNGEQAQYTITVHIIRDTELLINNKVYTISGNLV